MAETSQALGKFAVDDMTRLRRFLVLGQEKGTCLPSAVAPSLENAQALVRLIGSGHGEECVSLVETYSQEGRVVKQDPLMFVLAVCAKFGDVPLKKRVYDALPRVCGTPTHLFSFLELSKSLRGPEEGKGWGSLKRKAIARWYNSQDPMRLAQGITKYRNRNGWRHNDVIRLAHVRPESQAHAECFAHVCARKGAEGKVFLPKEDQKKNIASVSEDVKASVAELDPPYDDQKVFVLPTEEEKDQKVFVVPTEEEKALAARVRSYLDATEVARVCEDENVLVELIRSHRLVREHCSTKLLSSLPVWHALLENMPMMAMLRNLNKMTSIGLLEDGSDGTRMVLSRLKDSRALQHARIHPMHVLLALKTYDQGHGHKGALSWIPVRKICNALDDAFYETFKFVKPTNKRFLLAVDVSGSMGCFRVGSTNMSAMEAAAAFAMTFIRTEPSVESMAFSKGFVPLNLSRSMRLPEVIRSVSGMPFSSTDCSLPMTWALSNCKPVDAFIVFTDCDTNCNKVPPADALRRYRREMGIDARLIVMAFTANRISIADPSDRGMLDVAGLDSALPSIVSDFLRGDL